MRKLVSLILAISMAVSLFVIAPMGVSAVPGDSVVLNQIYGVSNGGGGSASHDFIELYNPTNATVDMRGWVIEITSTNRPVNDNDVNLNIIMSPGARYFIKGKYEDLSGNPPSTMRFTQDDNTDCDLYVSNMIVDNKNFLVLLKDGSGNVIDGLARQTTAGLPAGVTNITGNSNNKHEIFVRGNGSDGGVWGIYDLRTAGPLATYNGLGITPVKSYVEGTPGGGTPAKLLIGSMFGMRWDKNDGACDRDFCEIYNPNDFDVVLTDNYSLHLKRMFDADNWFKLDLVGTIPAKHSFLVASPVQNVGAALVIASIDQLWDTIPFTAWAGGTIGGHNKGEVWLITSNQNALTIGAGINPWDLDGNGRGARKVDGYVDIFGVSGNDNTSPSADGFAGARLEANESAAQSKQKIFTRGTDTNGDRYVDTDNNLNDFYMVDLRTDPQGWPAMPRSLADGEYKGGVTSPARDIVSIEMLSKVTVPFGTAKSAVVLPETVSVGLDNGGSADVPVTWASSTYNANVADTYTFTGTLVLTGLNITNSFGATASVDVEVLAAGSGIKASIKPQTQDAPYDLDGIVSFDITAENYTDMKNFMIDFKYDAAKLILQNTDSDEGVYTIQELANGNTRLVYTLPAKATSVTEKTLFTLKFKMTAAAKDSSATVTLNGFYAGIDKNLGAEEIAAVTEGTATVSFTEFSYDINGDGKVDLGDLVYAESFYGAKEGDANWNTAKAADTDRDGRITVGDLINIARYIASNHAK